ncbi:arylamine N-acetyltransferase family protein [Bremerella volcania]|nr:arylamine N-acetyltransferase [Bremerella volcania]
MDQVASSQESVSDYVDLDAYFRRIGYEGPREATPAVLNDIVHAHVLTIPFENLDVLLGKPILLDPASLQKKLVHDRRGGYCFEQNGLLLLVLEAMGYDVAPISARVKLGYARGEITPRTHLVVRIEMDGSSWLADVGVGGLSPTAVLKLELDLPQKTPHETRRIVRDGDLTFHQALLAGQWEDVYQMTMEQMPLIDREVANWYTSTSPKSRFKNLLMVAKAAPSGVRLTMLNDEFSVRDANGKATKTPIGTQEEMLDLLAEHFGVELEGSDRANLPVIRG